MREPTNFERWVREQVWWGPYCEERLLPVNASLDKVLCGKVQRALYLDYLRQL